MIAFLKQWLAHSRLRQSQYLRACERLAEDVERRRTSFETQDYAKRRAAALKGIGRA